MQRSKHDPISSLRATTVARWLMLVCSPYTKNSLCAESDENGFKLRIWLCVRACDFHSVCIRSGQRVMGIEREGEIERERDATAKRMNQHMRQIAEANIICVFLLASTLVTFDCKPISNFVFSVARAFLTWDFGVIDLRFNKQLCATGKHRRAHTHVRARNHTSSTSLHLSRSIDPDIDHRITFSFSQQIKSLLARSLVLYLIPRSLPLPSPLHSLFLCTYFVLELELRLN